MGPKVPQSPNWNNSLIQPKRLTLSAHPKPRAQLLNVTSKAGQETILSAPARRKQTLSFNCHFKFMK